MAKKFIVEVRERGFIGSSGGLVETRDGAECFDNIRGARGAAQNFAKKNKGAQCTPRRISG